MPTGDEQRNDVSFEQLGLRQGKPHAFSRQRIQVACGIAHQEDAVARTLAWLVLKRSRRLRLFRGLPPFEARGQCRNTRQEHLAHIRSGTALAAPTRPC